MPNVQLKEIARARSGDKGNTVNIGLIAKDQAWYDTLVHQVTSKRVSEHFDGLVEGEVTRYELPNIHALNFVCTEALGGGGSSSLRLDNLGKCFASNLLRLEVKVEKNKVD
ncbi:hypothetical protein GLW08_04860 [Pontibacillus yanchengensis]|uniref:Uncharacterized protein n=2 Tax=Pontibacillus yanchengensis TaxID=462910 RepID=A0ACC7VET3_9BACI|nr:hypothetical protein [Pontibacillus yanchengensis]MYL32084.1 hypothetical protein [Pontibacillus yanchengensis]MYL52664.1 hypothetical protein [Pontibacillus yanchengensis]